MNSITTDLLKAFPSIVYRDSNGQDVCYVEPQDYKSVVQYLDSNCDVTMCLDVTATDYLRTRRRIEIEGINYERFELVSNFISHQRNERIRLVVQINEYEPNVDSICDIYPGVNFAEREVFDMFGITFDGHPDLTRILMPDEWEGYPLRKDDAPSRIPVNFSDDTKIPLQEAKEFS